MDRRNVLSGEINVSQVMAEANRLREWLEHQRRNAEWYALKAWWQAQRQLRRATSPAQRLEARQGLVQTARLYRAELRRAWPKWNKVERARRMGSTYHLPEESG